MAQPSYSTLPQWWRACCQERGGQIALRQKRRGIWTPLSWADWYSQSRALALALADLGIGPGDVVTLLSENRTEWLIFDLAVQAMGAISHGLYPSGSVSDLKQGLHEAGSRILVVDGAAQYGKWLETQGSCPAVQWVVAMDTRGMQVDGQQLLSYAALLTRGETLTTTGAEAFEQAINTGVPAQAARLVCTAGSAGQAQTLMIPQRGVIQQLRTSLRWLELNPGDRTLSVVSLANAGEYMLSLGATLVSRSVVHFPESPATVFSDMREVAPQMVFATAWFWRRLHQKFELSMQDSIALGRRAYRKALAPQHFEHGVWITRLTRSNLRRQLGLQAIRMAISGGTAIGDAQIEWYAALGVPLFEAYGLAQTSGFCALVPTQAQQVTQGHTAQLRLDDRGQVLVCAPGLMADTWVQGVGQADERADVDAWLATGDYGVLDVSGRVRVIGRLKDHIAHDGSAVIPGFAERELRRSKFIADAMVVGSKCPEAAALVLLEFDAAAQHAHERQLAFTDQASLARHPDIESLIAAEVAVANRQLPEAQQVRRFRILENSLSAEDQEVAPTMRLRRHVVERVYAPLIASMQASDESACKDAKMTPQGR